MQRYRRLAGGRDDRPSHTALHPPWYSRSSWSCFDAAAQRPGRRASTKPLAGFFRGARGLVVRVGPRSAQRNSFRRPTRAAPPLLPGLRGGYRAWGLWWVRRRLVCPDMPLPTLRRARHESLAACLVVNIIPGRRVRLTKRCWKAPDTGPGAPNYSRRQPIRNWPTGLP